MNEIGQILKNTRENVGVSLEEVSDDLHIKKVILENIEEGNIGPFKDIFLLKEYLQNYAKYLGLDPDDILEEFNSYMFEHTSRIPIKDIEKKIADKEKELKGEKKISSPYTTNDKQTQKWYWFIVIGLAIIIGLIGLFWAVKQIVISSADVTSRAVSMK